MLLGVAVGPQSPQGQGERSSPSPACPKLLLLSSHGSKSFFPHSAALGSCSQAQKLWCDLGKVLGKSFVSLETHQLLVVLHKRLSLRCFAPVLST